MLSACLLAGPVLTSCQDDYDDTALWDTVNDLEQRLAALEEWQEQVNQNIQSLHQLINTTDYITSVTPYLEGGKEVGYTITFLHSDPITIYHGKKGDKGDKGEQGDTGDKGEQGDKGDTGADGYTPQIGLTQQDDGNWYWTLDGQLMTDPQGNPIRANGIDGQDGADGEDGEDGADGKPGQDGQDGKPGQDGQDGAPAPVPQIKLGSTLTGGTYYDNDGTKQTRPDSTAWYLSVDDGQTWYRITGDKGATGATGPQGPAGDDGDDGQKGEDGKDGDTMFANPPITKGDNCYIFHLADGETTFSIPIYQEKTLTIGDGTGIITLTGTTQEIDLTYPTGTTATDYAALVAQITPEGTDGTYTDISTRAGDAGGWSVAGDLENAKVTVNTPGGKALLRVTLIGTDGSELTASCVLELPIATDGATITGDGTYIVKQGTYTRGITINGNATVQLAGVTIKYDTEQSPYGSAISITGGSPTLVIEGANTLIGVGDAAIALSNGAGVIIQGLNGRNDKLTASSEISPLPMGCCAGIGNAWEEVGGNITISNVTVMATGGGDDTSMNCGGAGIGTSSGGTVGDITIIDATVVATGACYAAGIGLGSVYMADSAYPSMGDVTISGSDITATGSLGAAAIGFPNGFNGGTFHAGKITITTTESYDTFISKLTVERFYNGGRYVLPCRIGKGDYRTATPPNYYGKGTGTEAWPGVSLTTADQTLTSQDGIARL